MNKTKKNSSRAIRLPVMLFGIAARNPLLRKLMVGVVLVAAAGAVMTGCHTPNNDWDYGDCGPGTGAGAMAKASAQVCTVPRDTSVKVPNVVQVPNMIEVDDVVQVPEYSTINIVDSAMVKAALELVAQGKGIWNEQDMVLVRTDGLPTDPSWNIISTGSKGGYINSEVNILPDERPDNGYPLPNGNRKDIGEYATITDCANAIGISANDLGIKGYATCAGDVTAKSRFSISRKPMVDSRKLRVGRRVWGPGDIDDDYAHLFHILQAVGTNGQNGRVGRVGDMWFFNSANSLAPEPRVTSPEMFKDTLVVSGVRDSVIGKRLVQDGVRDSIVGTRDSVYTFDAVVETCSSGQCPAANGECGTTSVLENPREIPNTGTNTTNNNPVINWNYNSRGCRE